MITECDNLSNFDIENLSHDIKGFQGVFSIDTLPNTPHGCGIINLDKSTGPGTHWVGWYNDPKLDFIEYFDPFGDYKIGHQDLKNPDIPKEIVKFLQKSGKIIKYNDGFLQDITSKKCGCFCVYYLKNRDKGIIPLDILNTFTQKPSINNENKVLMI